MGGQAQKVLNVARGEVGYREGDNNYQKYSPAVPGLEWSQNQAWCQTFQSWIFRQAGVANLAPVTAGCAEATSWYKNKGRFSEFPAIGAMVFYGPGGGSHVGIVYKYDATNIYTVEGNTNDSGSAEGNGVYFKVRDRFDDYIYGYGYPQYDTAIVSADPAYGGTKTASDDPNAKETVEEYTVVTGDTFTGIATKTGVAVDALSSLNNLISVGKQLIVPTNDTYKVRDGDTLLSIVTSKSVSIQDLMTWNRIVATGQILNLSAPGVVPAPPIPVQPPVVTTPGKILASQVLFTGKDDSAEGKAFCQSIIQQGLKLMGLPVTDAWVNGYLTMAVRESAYNAKQWRVNTVDSNAVGKTVSDGNPFQCSRGAWQCIPQTFAENHQAGTSLSIYDPVANFCASVNYVRSRYGVAADGSNLASKVQQADPNRPPKGY